MNLTDAAVIERTRRWVDRLVIGLNLCPFAKAVQVKEQVHYVVSGADTEAMLLADLEREIEALLLIDPLERDTTLLIHPRVLAGFEDYNSFLADADDLLEERDAVGVLQVASFHPDYCFADSSLGDPANFTNRSPYPMLHLLRESSVSRAVDAFPDASTIYERNIQTLRALGQQELTRLLRGTEEDEA